MASQHRGEIRIEHLEFFSRDSPLVHPVGHNAASAATRKLYPQTFPKSPPILRVIKSFKETCQFSGQQTESCNLQTPSKI